MTSFTFVLVVYLLAYRQLRRVPWLVTAPDRRIALATILALAGSHANAERSGAADVAQNPIVLETAIRGAAGLAALLILSGSPAERFAP